MRTSASTLRPGSLWTRRGLTRFRAERRAGFQASRAITAMWWDCRWRWSGGCWRGESIGELRLLFFFFYFFFFLWFFSFFHCGLEVTDAVAEALAERTELAGAENQKRDAYD